MSIFGSSSSFVVWCLIAYTGILLILLPLASRYLVESKKNIELLNSYNKNQELLHNMDEALKEIKNYLMILKDRDSRYSIQTTKISNNADDVYNLGEYIATRQEIEDAQNVAKRKPRKIDRIKSINNED